MVLDLEIGKLLNQYDKNPEIGILNNALEQAEKSNSALDIYYVTAYKALKETEYEKAETFFKKVIEIVPTHRGAITRLCISLLKQGEENKLKEIIRIANNSISDLTNDSKLYNFKAVAHIALREFKYAISAALQAIKEDKKDKLGYQNYVEAQLRLKNVENIKKILMFYEKNVGNKEELIPDIIGIIFKAGNTYLSSGDIFAKALYELVLELDKKYGHAWFNLGLLYTSIAEMHEAREAFKNAIANLSGEDKNKAENKLSEIELSLQPKKQ